MSCPHSERRPAGQRAAHSQAKGFYSRLFPAPVAQIASNHEEKLIELGEAMRYRIEREGILTPRTGYTYFGQFVGHDLSYDTTRLDGPHIAPELTPNYRTPYLDLDHIYGGGPNVSPNIYEGESGSETFKLGATTPNGYLRDLPIENGVRLIGDQGDTRNLDNIIVRQLHVTFLKFHNEAVRQLSTDPPKVLGIERLLEGTTFEKAQRLVRWHYQWIVRHDFLPRILHPTVWQRGPPNISTFSRNGHFAIPLEFSLAAYRFGHSMVRNAYGLNCRRKRVELHDLMLLGQQSSPLSDDCVIEWGRFFDGLPASGPVASSSFIDTSIVNPLHGLSLSTVQVSNKMERSAVPNSLPVRSLLRGARAGLPPAQQVADELIKQKVIETKDRLTDEQLTDDSCDRSGSVLRKTGLQHETPLFYYVLKEAGILGSGLTLGPIGSAIIAHVIRGALESDPESYLSVVGPNWTLPSWRFPSGSRGRVNSVIGVIRLVGDAQLLPDCDATRRRFRRLWPQ
jgi:hypothetical protein